MKKTLLLSLALALAFMVKAQTVIDQPKVGMSTTFSFWINKIELSDTATVLYCHVVNQPKTGFQIPKDAYLLPVGTKDTLYIISAEGIPLGKYYTMTSSGNVDFTLLFPKVDPSVELIDFGEPGDDVWNIYDIQLKPGFVKSLIPEKLAGNWFRKDNARWEISLMDSLAVYKSKVWKYGKYNETAGIGTLILKNGAKQIKLFTKIEDNGSIRMGESPAKLSEYSNDPDESVIPEDKEEFKVPDFRRDTAVYCGVIKNFCKRYPRKTGIIYVNDILSGEQIPVTYKIDGDGYYEAKVPMTNPQNVIVRSPLGGSQMIVFLEPGKRVFEMIDKPGKQKRLYMGDNARINSDLIRIKAIDSFSFPEMIDKITDFTPEQYLLFCENSFIKDQNKLKEYAEKSHLSVKAYKLLDLQQKYRFAINALSYQTYFTGAYRTKNKIPNTQREIPVKPATPDKSYYSFLTNELVNDPLGVITSEYYFVINRLKYSELLRTPIIKGFSMTEIAAALEKSGVKLSSAEKELAQKMAEFDVPEIKNIESEFQKKYGSVQVGLFQKYSAQLRKYSSENKSKSFSFKDVKEYLVKEGVQLSDEENSMIEASVNMENNPLMQKRKAFATENREMISKFNTDHGKFVTDLYSEQSSKSRKEKLENLFGSESKLVLDIMNAQDVCQQIQREMLPLDDQLLKNKQKSLTTPAIADYLRIKNDEMKARIAANKSLSKDKKGAVVREVPKTSGDKVFDAIVSNYKGKVVFVDFWATWCAPCRAGIERIKPLKEELSKENIAFVYITNQSSPKTTYDNMVPDIKGDHYRLSTDEFNVIADRFKISGIPHYMLIGKDGKIINEHLSYFDNLRLKELLMKYVKE